MPANMSLHNHRTDGAMNGNSGKMVSVADLTGPREGTPDRHFTLTAQKKTVTLSSGKTVDAWTYNGQIPGPELRMKEGELIEVTLMNEDIDRVLPHIGMVWMCRMPKMALLEPRKMLLCQVKPIRTASAPNKWALSGITPIRIHKKQLVWGFSGR